MAKIIFYDTSKLDEQQLRDAFKSTDHHLEFVSDKIELESCHTDAEIISVFTTSTVTREMIAAMPKLTLIACRSTGYNHIDREAASDHGVTVVNVPTYGEATVAEYAFTLLLSLTRKLQEVLEIENEQFVPEDLTGIDLFGKTFGSIGSGHIGQKALKIANGFSMTTLAYDAFPNESLPGELHFTYVSLEELLERSDFVSLHLPLLPDTRHILNKERLQMMKPGSILVNTARGGLLDTRALIEALTTGHLGGAALDVIEGEQLLNFEEETALLQGGNMPEAMMNHSLEISILKKMPNVIISPHNAYNTVGAIGRINNTTAQNIIGFYNHDTPNSIPFAHKRVGKLILLRHLESEWNATGTWTGMTDVCLSEKGKADCKPAGKTLKELGIDIDIACHTNLSRTKETLDGVCEELDDKNLDVICEDAFTERDYGDYTGKNKWEVKEQLGEEKWNKIRRGWDEPVPNGETLKDVYERVVPVYEEKIVPILREGKNVLLVAHGNSLRALMKFLDSIPDDKIEHLEMPISNIMVYEINPETGRKKSGRTVEIKSSTGESSLA